MADKLTPKQEAFALKYVECSNQSEAYRHAYNAENMSNEAIWVEACRTAAIPRVALMVFQLQEKAQERTLVTVESLTEELNESRHLAVSQDNAGEMTKATMAKAKIHGLDVHKIDLTGHMNVTIGSDDADL